MDLFDIIIFILFPLGIAFMLIPVTPSVVDPECMIEKYRTDPIAFYWDIYLCPEM